MILKLDLVMLFKKYVQVSLIGENLKLNKNKSKILKKRKEERKEERLQQM